MESEVTIAVARHGQTDANVRGLWVGSGDDPLNEKGREQARELAKSLSVFHFDFIVSSDKKRAIETAGIISEILGVPIFCHKMELRDRHYGVLEGLTTEQIREKYNVDMKSLSREIDDLGEIETVSSVIKRVSEFVASATTNFGGKNIVVITHGAFIRSFYEMYVNNSNGVRFTNCSHFIVQFKNGKSEVVRDLTVI